MSALEVHATSSDHCLVERTLGHGGERVAFLNLGDAPDWQLDDDLTDAAADGVGVLGLCEAADRHPMLAAFMAHQDHPWRMFAGEVPGGAAVPLLWDTTRWQLREAQAITAVPRRWVGPAGAGPTWAKAKVVTRAELVHRRTGVAVVFLVTHPIPSVTRPGLQLRERHARRRHYRAHLRTVAQLVLTTPGPVVVMLDANAVRGARQLRPLRRAGLAGFTPPTRPTHDSGRAIDHVLYRDTP